MAEIDLNGWRPWVSADSTRTWFDAGVEARRRMAVAGFDVDAGDIWAVNEFSSAVRTNTGAARQNMRDLVRGLYTGDGTTPVQGLIWVSGIGQATTNLGPYKTNVKLWLGDAAFWSDMGQYVRFFSQEVYANASTWAVAGATAQDRLGPLPDYLEHFRILAGHGPDDVSAGSAYIALANAPTANAAWPRPGFDWGPATNTLPDTAAQDFISAQVYGTWSTDRGTIVPDGDTATLTQDDGPDLTHVTVTADDGNGGTATSTTDVEVRNVPPTVDAGADTTADWRVPLRLTGSASDPSHADTEDGLLPEWSFGDGSTGEGRDVSHVYANPGVYTATLTVRDKDGGVGSDSATITVGARPVSLAGTTSAAVDAGSAVVSARLVDGRDASSSRLDGHSVALTIGSSTCFATTDAAGAAHCRLDGSSLPLGPATATARFDGDTLYQAASTSSPVLLYRLPAGGVFAVGDESAGGQVTFWSPSWWLANTLTGGAAPASFKGFVRSSGSGWTASPGFASAPTTVPGWMGVLVTKSVTKDGAVIAGDGMHMVVVHVDNYDPTIVGLGTVVATAS